MANIKQLIAEIIFRDKSKEGADSAAKSFDKVGDAAEKSSRVIERTEKTTTTAERAYQRLQRRLDPLATAQERLKRDQDALRRAQEQGVISTDKYERNLQQLNRQFDATRLKIEQNERAQRGLNSAFGGVGRVLSGARTAILGFFAAFSFGALISGARQAIEALDEIAKKARSLGSIETSGFLQQARFALGQQGFSQEGTDSALAKLSKNIGDLKINPASGLGTLLDELEGGAQLREQLKAAKDIREQFELVVAKLNEIPDAATRASLATAIFGKQAGANIGAIAEGGVEGFRSLAEEASEAGLVVEKDLLIRAEELSDRLDKASNIIKIQMRRAFLELGPIIVDLIEMVAGLIKRVVDFMRDQTDPERRLERIVTIESREQRDAERNLERARTGEFGLPGFALPRAENRLNKATSALDHAKAALAAFRAEAKAGSADFDDAAGGIEDIGESASTAAESLDELRDKRDAVFTRLESAQRGRAALETFDSKAAIDDAVKASGLVGDQAKEFRRLSDEIQNAEAKTKALTVGFDKAAKAAEAAAKIKFDPLSEFDLDTERLEALIAAAKIGPEELDRAERRLAIEDRIARLKIEASRAAADLDEDAAGARLKRIDELTVELATITDSQSFKDSARDFGEPYRRELFDVARDFVQRLGRGDLSSFRDFARRLKDILFTAVLDPFANAFGGLISGLFGGFAGGNPAGAIFTPGILGPRGGAGGGFGGFGGFGAGLGPLAAGIGGLSLGGTAGTAFGLSALLGAGNIGRGVASLGNFLGLAGGTTDFLAGGLSRLGTFGGALGGIGGSLLSGALFGKSGGQQIGSTIGGIAGSFIPVPVLGPLIGSFLGGAIGSLFAGKPSNEAAGVQLNLDSFETVNNFAKKNNEENIRTRDTIVEQTTAILQRLVEITGASFSQGAGLVVTAGTRDISIGGSFGERRVGATDIEGAIQAAVQLSIRGLSGGDSALLDITKQLVEAGGPIEKTIERIEKLAAALDAGDEPVDAFKERLESLIDAFEGLDRSSGALKNAFDDAIDKLGERANEENRKALDSIINPVRAALAEQLDAFTARRSALEEIQAQGGNVDLSLFDELARRQILGQFNAPDRLEQANDPTLFAINQLRSQQAQELAALQSAVGQFGITESDISALIRAQSAERRSAFRSLSDEDKLRLAGQAEDFVDLGGQFALAVDRMLQETERLVDGFDEERQRLQDIVSLRTQEADSLGGAIIDLDRFALQETPRQNLETLRAQAEDLGRRAVSGETEEERAFARAQLPAAVQAFVERSRDLFASGTAFQNDVDFARGLLEAARTAASQERSVAQRQLDALESTRDTLTEIRDLLAKPQLDIAAVVEAAGRLDPDSDAFRFALQIAELEAQRTTQNERLIEALERITAEEVGLGSAEIIEFPTSAAPSATAVPVVFGADTIPEISSPAVQTTPPQGSQPPSRDGEIIAGLRALIEAIDDQTGAIVDLDKVRKAGDDRREGHLRAIAGRRESQL